MEEQKSLKHVCKFCKKSFACGRSLGGHIRCHLPKPGYELRDNPKKTWRAADHGDVLITDSSPSSASSETETEKPKVLISELNQSHGKRSSFAGNHSYSSVSEVVEAEEQEEVAIAMCLIMLSKDVGHWANNSKSVRRRRETKQGIKDTVFSAVNGEKMESLASGCLQKGLKMKGNEVSGNGFVSNHQSNKLSENQRRRQKVQGKFFQVSENGFASNDQNHKLPESKRKVGDPRLESAAAFGYGRNGSGLENFRVSENGFLSNDQKSNDHELGVTDEIGVNSELLNNNNTPDESYCKRSKFECTTCNKVFHSYQALGGHRASHKKLLGVKCSSSSSKLEEKEIVSNDDSPSPRTHDQPQQQPQETQEQQKLVPDIGIGSSSSKKVVQKHECPICFRVFTSGQALGGHKRSHLLVCNGDNNGRTSEGKISQSSKTVDAIERSSSSIETRDLLDLNLPPANDVQEEPTTTTATSSSNSLVGFIKPYWWVETSHKHESFLGLISN